MCTYCNLFIFSSSMAKHIKDKHQKEAAAEQESRAECWEIFTSPQAKGKQQQVESDGVDTTEKEKQPRTELLDCVTELLESKLNEVMNQIRFLPSAGRFLIRLCDLVGAPRGRSGPFFCLPGRGGHLGGPTTKWGGWGRPAGHAAVPPAVPR